MKSIGVLALMVLAVSSWAQSLGEVARATRERPKQPATKVITNEDLKPDPTDENASGPSIDLKQEIEHMRRVFHQICTDPRTQHGSKLSDYDKQEIAEGVKPLRARVKEFERIQKQYKDALAALDADMEAESKKAFPVGRPFNQKDIEKMKSMQEDYESRKAALIKRGESELQGYQAMQKELESVGNECPEAAKTVPD